MFLRHSRVENVHQLVAELAPSARPLAKAHVFGHACADFSVSGILDNWPANDLIAAGDIEPLLRLDLVRGRSEDRTGAMTDSELAHIAWRVIDAAPVNINDRPWAAMASDDRIVILADVFDATAGRLDVWDVGRLAERELAAITAQLADEHRAGPPGQETPAGVVRLISAPRIVVAHAGGTRAHGLLRDAGFRDAQDESWVWLRTPHGLSPNLIQAMAAHAERILDLGGYHVVRSTRPTGSPTSPRVGAARHALGPTPAVPAVTEPPAGRAR